MESSQHPITFEYLCNVFNRIQSEETRARKREIFSDLVREIVKSGRDTNLNELVAVVLLSAGQIAPKRHMGMNEKRALEACSSVPLPDAEAELYVTKLRSNLEDFVKTKSPQEKEELLKRTMSMLSESERIVLDRLIKRRMLLGIGCVNILRALAATFAERLTTTERALGKELYYTYEKNRDYEAIVRILFTSKDYEKACQLLKDLRSVEVGKPTNLVTSSDDMERKNPKYTWEKEPVYGDQLQIHYSSQKEQLLCFKGQDVIYDSLKHGQDKREFFKLYEELRNRKTISFIVEAQYSEDDKILVLFDLVLIGDNSLQAFQFRDRKSILAERFKDFESINIAEPLEYGSLQFSKKDWKGKVAYRAQEATITQDVDADKVFDSSDNDEIIDDTEIGLYATPPDYSDPPRYEHLFGEEKIQPVNISLCLTNIDDQDWFINLSSEQGKSEITLSTKEIHGEVSSFYGLLERCDRENMKSNLTALEDVLSLDKDAWGEAFSKELRPVDAGVLLDCVRFKNESTSFFCRAITHFHEHLHISSYYNKLQKIEKSIQDLNDSLEKTTTSTVSMIVNEEEKREAFRLALHYLFEEVIFSVVNCTFDFSTLISNIRDNIKQLRRPGDQEIEHGDLDSKAKALLLQIGVSNVCKDWNKDRKEAAYKSILSKLEECYKDGEQKMNEMEHIKKGIQKACLQFHRVLNKKCGNSDEMTKATAVYNAFCNCSQIELQGAEQHPKSVTSSSDIDVLTREAELLSIEDKDKSTFKREFKEVTEEFQKLLNDNPSLFEQRPAIIRQYCNISFRMAIVA
ncbi:hypothetical protein QR680_015259 [Steinernema hermaphroditum]|uniref:Uncharacterized protein n=1 Tax=Steinernema hermaphroditum TaxID=289476 RepID=A0AA39H733_9BILA|nr:hypothetical protein QR680_015259 [Steinernema hermaphroditum]